MIYSYAYSIILNKYININLYISVSRLARHISDGVKMMAARTQQQQQEDE